MAGKGDLPPVEGHEISLRLEKYFDRLYIKNMGNVWHLTLGL